MFSLPSGRRCACRCALVFPENFHGKKEITRNDETGNLVKDDAEGIDSIYWDASGKVKHVERDTSTDVVFGYDSLGNRLTKEIRISPDPDSNIYYYYVRDAQGNVIAFYEKLLESGIQNTYRGGPCAGT